MCGPCRVHLGSQRKLLPIPAKLQAHLSADLVRILSEADAAMLLSSFSGIWAPALTLWYGIKTWNYNSNLLSEYKDSWMKDGWINGWVGGWMDEWVDRWWMVG